jgi:hypothetical protein
MAELADKGDIRQLLEALVELEPQGKKSRGLRARIAEERDLIVQAIRRGHSATAIARKLHENGFGSSVDTLRAYVAEVAGRRRTVSHSKKTVKSASRAEPKQPKQPPVKQVEASPVAQPETQPESLPVTDEQEGLSGSPKPFGIAGRKF